MNIHKTCRIGEAEYPVLKRINMEIESGEFIATPGALQQRQVHAHENSGLPGLAPPLAVYSAGSRHQPDNRR
ncbi:MAG: hypothetical protein E4G89_04490 [Methanothrix sp.]|nr:MAG: hypothetical protein E4G89_04490 [Methanothrix sp.]